MVLCKNYLIYNSRYIYYLIVQPGDYLCMSVIESFKASVSWICRIENLKIMCELRVHLRAPKCNRILSLVVKH